MNGLDESFRDSVVVDPFLVSLLTFFSASASSEESLVPFLDSLPPLGKKFSNPDGW